MGCQTTMPMTEFDIITTDDTTQMMKAIIPYIDFPLQKNMAIMIRIKELQDTIRCYSSSQRIFLNKASCGSNDMMDALCKYGPPDIASGINTIRQMSQFSDIMKMYNDLEQSSGNVMNDAASQDTNFKCCLKCTSLAFVNLMVKHSALRIFPDPVKRFHMPAVTSVIHENDIFKSMPD